MKKIRNFLKDRSGATAVTFALLLVPIVGMTGLAVDYTRASTDRARLQGAADSAALAGASVFTGLNKSAAEESARAYLRGNLGAEADKVKITFSAADQRVTVAISGETNSLFMQLLNKDKVAIGVTSQALAPLKPTSVKFYPGDMYGWYYKKVSIVVVKGGKETVVGTISYTSEYRSGPNSASGRGTGKKETIPPSGTNIDLGEFDSLYLKMEVKNDGCPIGQKYSADPKDSNHTICVTSNASADSKYNKTLRTDDVNTVHYLFVDGVQLKQGSKPPLDDLFNCDGSRLKHAWEDGGGFALQDFFYEVTSGCKAVDNENVRLTH
ncbi:TadE/TadG family type IV pilus assembly protein [Phyllobacterium sp. YR531]|uniref:TadE/TadG family type IV pilus assembly protein n=1 Tax=Phyllobacterium sp. YR531 TaxID=1144343 RepID=UPI00026F6C6B|nr:TadE/TadG family type IV pilus assembly protein [Phyllobacterium sp. YR531]EJN05155.1 Flp pilus assembly protein TadG [Phyllobacterium sp. YR531]